MGSISLMLNDYWPYIYKEKLYYCCTFLMFASACEFWSAKLIFVFNCPSLIKLKTVNELTGAHIRAVPIVHHLHSCSLFSVNVLLRCVNSLCAVLLCLFKYSLMSMEVTNEYYTICLLTYKYSPQQ